MPQGQGEVAARASPDALTQHGRKHRLASPASMRQLSRRLAHTAMKTQVTKHLASRVG